VRVSTIAACLVGGAVALSCCIAEANEGAATLKTLYQFPGGGDGLAPWGGLVDVGGTLYGTNFEGGAYGRGAVFSINPQSGAEKLVYSFTEGTDASEPQAGPLAVGGLLYGTSNAGGAYGYGAVYSVNPATGAEAVLFSFTPAMGGGSGSSLVENGGYLYGTTFGGGTGAGYGCVFKVKIATGKATVLHAFAGGADGASPQYGVAYAKGVLYGTTTVGGASNAGTIFAVDAKTGAETTLFTFDGATHGGSPDGGVIDVNGVLYGTAAYGGSAGAGLVFAYSLGTGAETTVHNFTNGADGGDPLGALLDVKGTLYGTTASGANGYGTVFSLNAATGAEATLYAFQGGADGQQSEAPVIDVGGALYGTDLGAFSTSSYHGTVFKIVLKTGAEQTLHVFQGAPSASSSALLDVGGTLYGATELGGASYAGTLFAINPTNGAQTTLYTFTGGADGGAPVGALVADGGTLYGVASIGGANQGGVIYTADPVTGAQAVVYNFPAAGEVPNGPLLLVKGLLYGTTEYGGSNGAGSVFAFDPTNGTLTTIYNFTDGTDGGLPRPGLTANGGYLYGTTYTGGAAYAGAVFEIDIATGAQTVLYNFTGASDGGYPVAPPIYLKGTLYGTTGYGGSQSADCFGGFGCGTLYSLDLTGNAYTVLHEFDYLTDGQSSDATLLAEGGKLYGSSWGNGEPSWGTIFTYAPASGDYNAIYNFTGGADGGGPSVPLIPVGATLFGTTSIGAAFNTGTVFSLKP
jgi:uncharacterized repeat protein (TIGR03803 family)